MLHVSPFCRPFASGLNYVQDGFLLRCPRHQLATGLVGHKLGMFLNSRLIFRNPLTSEEVKKFQMIADRLVTRVILVSGMFVNFGHTTLQWQPHCLLRYALVRDTFVTVSGHREWSQRVVPGT